MNILATADIYGSPFMFTTFGTYKFKTSFGGILTGLTLVIAVLFSFLFGRDFYFRKNPKIVISEINPKDPVAIPINTTNFTIMFRVDNYDNKPLWDFQKYFYLEWMYGIRRWNDTLKSQESVGALPLDIKLCSELKSILPETAQMYNLDDWLCIDLYQYNATITMGGSYEDKFFNNLYFTIYFCDGLGDHTINGINKCSNLTEAYHWLETTSAVFSMMYPVAYFNPNSLDKPLDFKMKTYSFPLQLNLVKWDYFSFSQIKLADDIGWIVQNVKNSTIPTFQEQNFDYRFYTVDNMATPGSDSNIYTLLLQFTKQTILYSRSYMKIQELLAVMGGFVTTTMSIFRIISMLMNMLIRNVYIFDELFSYDEKDIKK
jgi:hypothetical protein